MTKNTDVPSLLLGPIARGTATDGLTIWVETDRECAVQVNGRTEQTFAVCGHHYALVDIESTAADGVIEYSVHLDGHLVCPPNDGTSANPARLQVVGRGEDVIVVGGSCRQQAPEPLWAKRKAPGFGDLGPDALATLAVEIESGMRPRPHLLLLTGDQVYADEQHESVKKRMSSRRGGPPQRGRPEVTSFEEYTWLYQHTWSSREIRWLLANVASLMIFDDHDIIDDWNISERWMNEMAQEVWWQDRIEGGLMSYWVYQHIGNLSRAERERDLVYAAVRAADDGEDVLRDLARRVSSGTEDRLDFSWSYAHEIGELTIAVLDARNARVLSPDQRSMLSPRDWSWLERIVSESDRQHLLVVTSVPWLLPRGIQRLERWVSRLANRGAGWRQSIGEFVRRAIDLEHWAAFGDSVQRLADVLDRFRVEVPDGGGTMTVLSGDVHFAYVCETTLRTGRQAVQVVSSPLRQVEMSFERAARQLSMSGPFRFVIGRQPAPRGRSTAEVDYKMIGGPSFENNLATLSFGAHARVAIDCAVASDDHSNPKLQRVFDQTR